MKKQRKMWINKDKAISFVDKHTDLSTLIFTSLPALSTSLILDTKGFILRKTRSQPFIKTIYTYTLLNSGIKSIIKRIQETLHKSTYTTNTTSYYIYNKITVIVDIC